MADRLQFRGYPGYQIPSVALEDREIMFDLTKNTLVVGINKDYLLTEGTGYTRVQIDELIAQGGGERGPQGIEGPQGVAGPQGPEGPQGETGESGPQGPRGYRGYTGNQGDIGPQGPQGVPGTGIYLRGTIDVSGPPSFDGTDNGDVIIDSNGDGWAWDGSTWTNVGPIRGPEGAIGPQGPEGPQGDAGPAGVQGPQGERGFIGPQGIQGVQGLQGVQGPMGNVGPQGETGPRGLPGEDGTGVRILGTIDYAGPPSFSGADIGDIYIDVDADGWSWGGSSWFNVGPIRGPKGETGAEGPRGPIGPTGLTGPTGSTGAQGAQGIQGERGEKGDQGDIGPSGPEGPPGRDGTDGTGIQLLGSISPDVGPPAFNGIQNGDMYIDVNGEGWAWSGSSWSNVGRIQGPAGPRGPQGVRGEDGVDGIQGPEGPAGPAGPQGLQGPKGDTGEQGPKGDPGDGADIDLSNYIKYGSNINSNNVVLAHTDGKSRIENITSNGAIELLNPSGPRIDFKHSLSGANSDYSSRIQAKPSRLEIYSPETQFKSTTLDKGGREIFGGYNLRGKGNSIFSIADETATSDADKFLSAWNKAVAACQNGLEPVIYIPAGTWVINKKLNLPGYDGKTQISITGLGGQNSASTLELSHEMLITHPINMSAVTVNYKTPAAALRFRRKNWAGSSTAKSARRQDDMDSSISDCLFGAYVNKEGNSNTNEIGCVCIDYRGRNLQFYNNRFVTGSNGIALLLSYYNNSNEPSSQDENGWKRLNIVNNNFHNWASGAVVVLPSGFGPAILANGKIETTSYTIAGGSSTGYIPVVAEYSDRNNGPAPNDGVDKASPDGIVFSNNSLETKGSFIKFIYGCHPEGGAFTGNTSVNRSGAYPTFWFGGGATACTISGNSLMGQGLIATPLEIKDVWNMAEEGDGKLNNITGNVFCSIKTSVPGQQRDRAECLVRSTESIFSSNVGKLRFGSAGDIINVNNQTNIVR